MEWRDFLELARELSKSGEESHQRTAISRAYYAALCATREWLEENQGEQFVSRDSLHRQIWDALNNDSSLSLGKGSRRLRRKANAAGGRLKKKRVWADYEKVVRGRVTEDVKQCLKDAEDVFDVLRELSERLARPPA